MVAFESGETFAFFWDGMCRVGVGVRVGVDVGLGLGLGLGLRVGLT